MKYLAFFFFLSISVFTTDGLAQVRYQVGLLPEFNFNTKLSSDWKLNLKAEMRYAAADRRASDWERIRPGYQLSDFSWVVSRKVGLNNKLAGGYLLRLRSGRMVHRGIQQFTLVRRYNRFRLGHRFATDQTFSARESPEFRLRYRLTAEFPLNGTEVDRNEWYLKVSNEYLGAYQRGSTELELRVIPTLGYLFTDTNKLEFGLDMRSDSFLEGAAAHDIWLGVSWYVAL